MVSRLGVMFSESEVSMWYLMVMCLVCLFIMWFGCGVVKVLLGMVVGVIG